MPTRVARQPRANPDPLVWPPAQELFKTVPLGIHDWTAIIKSVLIPIVVIDQVKLAFTRKRRSA